MIESCARGSSLAAWHCTSPLDQNVYREMRRHLELHCCKWDTQVGDTTTLAPFAVILPPDEWRELARLAERLAAELHAAENEIAARPRLWPTLGLPGRVRRVLDMSEPWTPAAARVIRFDFHPTDAGWKISEANGDVPGGYIEATELTQFLAERTPAVRSAGDPTAALCDSLTRHTRQHRRIALLAAPGYVSDHQINAYLANALHARGIETILARPEQLRWVDGIAHVGEHDRALSLDAIFRFYQGEWMVRQRRDDWRFLFRGGRTPVCNPAAALLSESKRLPLLWSELETPMLTWRELLPETRSPFGAGRFLQDNWILKAAYGNNGEAVFSRSWSRKPAYLAARASAVLFPRRWIVQRAFECAVLPTPLGPMFPCIGVYTIDGVACGLYGRLTRRPPIDFAAMDVALLIST